MSELIEKIVLGIIQGITEFLPVSSSGHLEIAKVILGDDAVADSSMLTTVVLHFATALATLYVYRLDVQKILKGLFRPVYNEDQKFAVNIILSMIPAAIVGILWDDLITAVFDKNLLLVGICLLVTAFLLLAADYSKPLTKPLSPILAIIIGIAQAIAILPGISRSGATISTSVLLGIRKEEAARFSFLMVVPLIFGKIAKDIMDGAFQQYSDDLLSLVFGFVAALITGVFACTWMVSLVQKSRLHYFSVYCAIVGVLAIVYSVS